MSYAELNDHPDKANLMSVAFTIQRGKGNGEYMRECNPVYQKQKAEMQAEIAKANGGT